MVTLYIANALTILAFLAHTFAGDKELKLIYPKDSSHHQKIEKWTMARAGWHWLSFDLLAASVLLALINFTDVIQFESYLLQGMAIYFLGYGLSWLIAVIISPSFPGKLWKLGQWMLMWLLAALVYVGA